MTDEIVRFAKVTRELRTKGEAAVEDVTLQELVAICDALGIAMEDIAFHDKRTMGEIGSHEAVHELIAVNRAHVHTITRVEPIPPTPTGPVERAMLDRSRQAAMSDPRGERDC
jgi:hypothetical protein